MRSDKPNTYRRDAAKVRTVAARDRARRSQRPASGADRTSLAMRGLQSLLQSLLSRLKVWRRAGRVTYESRAPRGRWYSHETHPTKAPWHKSKAKARTRGRLAHESRRVNYAREKGRTL
jgi:hypothetical protein